MSLITLQDVSLSFGGAPILDQVNLQIEPGERLCLVGRNGEGKSTLLQLLAGALPHDSGRIIRTPGLKTAQLAQEVPAAMAGTVYEVVAGGLGELFSLLARHHALGARLAAGEGGQIMTELEEVTHLLETAGGWQAEQRVDTVLTRLAIAADQRFADLSGGMKRRVMLARALISDPDLLLLDEPTNHLDIDSIAWLEEFLTTTAGRTLLFVTHDRLFARRLATRIVDLDRGKLTSWPGTYADYLRRKDELLAVEAEQDKKFDKKLSQEEAWIRQGVKARRTRNQGRVRALLKIREERAARRNQIGKARMQLQEAEVAGKLRVRAENISYRYGERNLVDNFSISIMRGDKVGIIGPNGCGKTTLLRMLLGRLEPQQGAIQLGTNLQVAYYDQLRAQLDEERSVADNVGDGNDTVMVNNQPRHIIGYLKDFLFTPDRARSPVKILSGGERNRLLLAKLFSRPANLLVLDEPTNDLDVETLELLEELLLDYQGTVLLVSHDRAFLNNVVTSTLVFEGNGRIQEYAGGYDDWLLQRPQPEVVPKAGKGGKKKAKIVASQPTVRKLSFKEKQELVDLPMRIEAMETEQQTLLDTLADPAFYQTKGADAKPIQARLDELETTLIAAFQRWEKLEALANNEAEG